MPPSKASLDFDFLGLRRENTVAAASSNNKSQLRRLYDRQRSFRGLPNAITKINPELLKASMAGFSHQDFTAKPAGGAAFGYLRKAVSVPSSPMGQKAFPALSINNPAQRQPASEASNSSDAAPFTIFYNGSVSVFELPQDKARTIMKFVEDGWFDKPTEKAGTIISSNYNAHSDWAAQRRMLQRNVSLQRFLEKRKERLTTTAMPARPGDDSLKFNFEPGKK